MNVKFCTEWREQTWGGGVEKVYIGWIGSTEDRQPGCVIVFSRTDKVRAKRLNYFILFLSFSLSVHPIYFIIPFMFNNVFVSFILYVFCISL